MQIPSTRRVFATVPAVSQEHHHSVNHCSTDKRLPTFLANCLHPSHEVLHIEKLVCFWILAADVSLNDKMCKVVQLGPHFEKASTLGDSLCRKGLIRSQKEPSRPVRPLGFPMCQKCASMIANLHIVIECPEARAPQLNVKRNAIFLRHVKCARHNPFENTFAA